VSASLSNPLQSQRMLRKCYNYESTRHTLTCRGQHGACLPRCTWAAPVGTPCMVKVPCCSGMAVVAGVMQSKHHAACARHEHAGQQEVLCAPTLLWKRGENHGSLGLLVAWEAELQHPQHVVSACVTTVCCTPAGMLPVPDQSAAHAASCSSSSKCQVGCSCNFQQAGTGAMGGRMLSTTCGATEPLTTGSVGVAKLLWLKFCARQDEPSFTLWHEDIVSVLAAAGDH
jgi:hypothetical protein